VTQEVILDIGEGAALNPATERQIGELITAVDEVLQETGFPREKLTLKPQLFENEPPNTPLMSKTFDLLHKLASQREIGVTASVFDEPSLQTLLDYPIPFVKIANRQYLRALKAGIPRGIRVVTSVGGGGFDAEGGCRYRYGENEDLLCCVSEYPATMEGYREAFPGIALWYWGMSDHTVGLDLWRKYRPTLYERHFAVDWMKGPSVGPWSIGVDELREILTDGGKV